MRTSAQRIAAYEARMQSSQLDPVRTATAPLQAQNFGAYVNDFVPKQLELRSYMDGQGYSSADYFAYEAANGELYHVWKTFAGAAAVAEATVIVAKYVALGLTEADLIAIAVNLYNIIVVPAAP